MVKLVVCLEQIKFVERMDGRKKVVARRPDRVGRRAGRPDVGLDGFMKDLDIPPFKSRLLCCRALAASVDGSLYRRGQALGLIHQQNRPSRCISSL